MHVQPLPSPSSSPRPPPLILSLLLRIQWFIRHFLRVISLLVYAPFGLYIAFTAPIVILSSATSTSPTCAPSVPPPTNSTGERLSIDPRDVNMSAATQPQQPSSSLLSLLSTFSSWCVAGVLGQGSDPPVKLSLPSYTHILLASWLRRWVVATCALPVLCFLPSLVGWLTWKAHQYQQQHDVNVLLLCVDFRDLLKYSFVSSRSSQLPLRLCFTVVPVIMCHMMGFGHVHRADERDAWLRRSLGGDVSKKKYSNGVFDSQLDLLASVASLFSLCAVVRARWMLSFMSKVAANDEAKRNKQLRAIAFLAFLTSLLDVLCLVLLPVLACCVWRYRFIVRDLSATVSFSF